MNTGNISALLGIACAFCALVLFTYQSCAEPEISPTSTGGFTKVLKHSIGTPNAVTPPIIVLKLACCDGDYCIWVDSYGECSGQAYYCNWGQSNPDGTVTCFD